MKEQAIFLEALDREPSERAAFLDEACGGDNTLRRAVETLLRLHTTPNPFLEVPAVEQLAAAPPSTERSEPDLSFLSESSEPGALGRLDHYEVLEVVGRGGMGIVLRARDTKLERVVALKVLAAPLAACGTSRQRFAREARAAAAVRDEHVIDIHAVCDEGLLPYLVMEYIDGCTLEELVWRRGPLEVKEVLRIGMQVASGLAAAHRHGLVHRDVKPANILLENGVQRVKLTDFGLARTVDDASLTQSGVVAGTPAYMSPEQANGEHVDHRSDLFSLGSVLYTLCAGRPPFRASSPMDVLLRVCDDTPRPLREVNPDIPDWLEAIVARLHAKDPADRFQTASEVADLLGKYLAHLHQPGIVAPTMRAESATPKPQAPPARGRRVAAVLLLMVAVLGASAVLYRVWRQKDAAKAPPDGNGNALQAPPEESRSPLTPGELTQRPKFRASLTRAAMALPGDATAEVAAVLGDPPRFPFPMGAGSHWMAQTGDGRLLAVPCGPNILLFEAGTGTLLQTLTGHTMEAYRPAFSPDGKHLASGDSNGILCVWDVATGRGKRKLMEHTRPVWSVAYHPAGKRLVSADGGGTILVRDAEGRPVKTLKRHTKGVNQLAFSPDGTRLATASLDGTCKIWDTDRWEEIHSLPGNGKTFEAVAWSRDGTRLAAGDDDEVILWDAESYERLHPPLKTPGKGLLAFSPDGHTLFTARHDCRNGERHAFTRWDVTTGKAKAPPCELPTFGSYAFFQLDLDGRTVFVTYHHPATARVGAYDAETGRERFPLRGHGGSVLAVAVSPDGRTLASGSEDCTVRLWDLAGWRPGGPSPPSRVLQGHLQHVCSVAFSPNGKLLASGATNGLVFLWDAVTGRKLHELPGLSPAGAWVTFSPDGSTVVAGGTDGTVNRWDAGTGQTKEPWRGHTGAVRAVAYSPDGQLLASGGQDGTVQLRDAAKGKLIDASRDGKFIMDLAFSPNGRTLAAVDGTTGSVLRLWDLETKTKRQLTGHTGQVRGVSFHPEGKMAATVSQAAFPFEDGTVRLWDITPSGQAVRTFDFRFAGGPLCTAFTPEGRYLAVGLGNGMIVVLGVPALPPLYAPAPRASLPAPAVLARRPAAADVLKRADIPEKLLESAGGSDKVKALAERVAIFEHNPRCHPRIVAFSPDGNTLAFGGTGNVVGLLDLKRKPMREQTWDLRSPETAVESLAFSPDGKLLACAARNGSILLWDVAAGAERPPLAHPEGYVAQIAFSPDGTLLASAGTRLGAEYVKLWNVATGQLLFTLPVSGLGIAWCVAFSPDGKTLAAGLQSGAVRLYDVASGWQIATLSGHGGRVRWLGFHPDGRSLVVAGQLPDNAVIVWDLATRKQSRRLSGHGSAVLSGAWRADGRLLLTAGATDGMVRLWDLGGDRPRSRALAEILPKGPLPHNIALSPEGRHLAVCDPNGMVHVLRLARAGQVFQVPADGAQ